MAETVRLGVRRVKAPPARRLGVEKTEEREVKWVDFDPDLGGSLCPECGERLKITNTIKKGKARHRYYTCENEECPETRFQSLHQHKK